MSELYHPGSRALQDQFDTRRLTDRIEERLVRTRLTPEDAAFIGGCDMFFLATADELGRPTCSYKGGAPGFVRVLDEQTIAFPSYDGNGMFLSLGNARQNPHVGLLFIDFPRAQRLRLNGEASVDPDDPLAAECVGAQLVVRVKAREIFPNCSRYIHRMALEERSGFVPRAGQPAPIPNWKRSSWACDVLPEGDPAADPDPTPKPSDTP